MQQDAQATQEDGQWRKDEVGKLSTEQRGLHLQLRAASFVKGEPEQPPLAAAA